MNIDVGIDIIEIERIRDVIERLGDKFLKRIFTEHEITTCKSRSAKMMQCFAARFAAKEAFMKSVGLGMNGLNFKMIEVQNLESGKPLLKLYGKAAEVVKGKIVKVSLSHTENYAVAIVIVYENSLKNL